MVQYVDAVYENGVLRPLEPLKLTDNQRVSLSISDPHASALDAITDWEYMAYLNAMEEEGPEPTLEEVQQAMSNIKGSLAEAVREERDARG